MSAPTAHHREIYMSSFPAAERRPWNDLCRRVADGDITFYDISGAGFLTVWDLGDAAYLEHFAVDAARRGGGIGARALDELLQLHPRLILEVEPEHLSDTAARRIAFYRRHNLIDRPEVPYVQPSYAPGLPPVALTLMTTPGVDLAPLIPTLHKRVYGYEGA